MTMTNTNTISVMCDRCRYHTYAATESELAAMGWANLGWAPAEMLMPMQHLCPSCTTAMKAFMKREGQ